jgi:hypothetical protein
MITFGDVFNLSICVSKAFTTCRAYFDKQKPLKIGFPCLIKKHATHIYYYVTCFKKLGINLGVDRYSTRIESEGSEPDKAAFLAAARLSTSSAA